MLTASPSASATYTHDALSERIRKASSGATQEYFFFGGTLLSVHNLTTGVWSDHIYGAGGNEMATATSNSGVAGATTWRIGDHLGSLSAQTDNSGNNLTSGGEILYSPYGQQVGNNSSSDAFLFTEHERDSETGDDYTMFRQYSSTQGRWTSPDPYSGSYSLTDPQSMNRYAYVTNRPMNETDDSGLDDCGSGGQGVPVPTNQCELSAGGCAGGGSGNAGGFNGGVFGNTVNVGMDGATYTQTYINYGNGYVISTGSFINDGTYYSPLPNTLPVQLVPTAGASVFLGPNGEELSSDSVQELQLPDPNNVLLAQNNGPQSPWLPQNQYNRGQAKPPGKVTPNPIPQGQPVTPDKGPFNLEESKPPGSADPMSYWMYILMQTLRIFDNETNPEFPIFVPDECMILKNCA